MAAGKPLTTTQVASILHCSRQHVVSLCDDGTLPYRRVGTHRRISQTDVQKLVQPGLTLEEERSLWMHYAIATKLVTDPLVVMDAAARRLKTQRDAHGDGRRAMWHSRWQQLLADGPSAVLDAITSRTPTSSGLRAASPLADLLTQEERARVLSSFEAFSRGTDSAVAS